MANIVEIVVRGLDQTKAPFTTAITNMASLEKAAKGMLGVLAGVATTAAGSLAALAVSAINAADEAGKAAQRAGITVEAWSRVSHAAKLANVENTALEAAFKNLNKTLVEATTDGTSKAAKLFQALGVAVTDANGRIRDGESVLKDLATQFAQFRDNASKSTLAAELFGAKMGPQLLPLLNQGGDAIDRAGKRANIVTKEMADQADQYKDNLDDLKASMASMGFALAREVLPQLVKFTQALLDAQTQTQAFGRVANFAIETLKVMAVGLHAIVKAFEIAGIAIGQTAGLLVDVWINNLKAAGAAAVDFSSGNMLGAFLKLRSAVMADASMATTVFKQAIADIKKEWASLEKFSLSIFPVDEPTAPGAPGPGSNPAPGPTRDATGIFSQIDQLNEYRESRSADTLERLGALEAELTEATLAGFERQRFAIDNDYNTRLRQIENLRVAEDVAAELSQLASKKRAAAIRGLYIEQAAATANLLGSLANSAAAFGKKGFAIYKVIASAEAVVSTAAGVARALKDYAFPYNIIVGGIVAAAGAAQIAKINSQKVAHTGLDYVPREEPYLLAPAERVVQAPANRDLTDFLESQRQGRGLSQMVNLSLVLDGTVLGRVLGQLTRDGRLEINERAIVAT